MKQHRTTSRCVLLLVLTYLWLVLDVDVATAQCPARGTVVVEDVSNAQGKPYQAREIRTIATYSNDGQKLVKVVKEKLFRDGGGRIRIERFYDGTDDPPESVPMDIEIDDNCGTSVSLLPRQQIAKVSKMAPPQRVSNRPRCEEVDLKNPPYTGPEGKSGNLGHKVVDGVQVRGERTSYYASVEAKLSGAPPVRVYEEWCSILLDTPMGSYVLNDQPKMEITTVISDVEQVEPDPALFEIPKEYKILRVEASAPAATPPRNERSTTPGLGKTGNLKYWPNWTVSQIRQSKLARNFGNISRRFDGVSVNGAAATVRFCCRRDRISRRSGRSFRLGA